MTFGAGLPDFAATAARAASNARTISITDKVRTILRARPKLLITVCLSYSRCCDSVSIKSVPICLLRMQLLRLAHLVFGLGLQSLSGQCFRECGMSARVPRREFNGAA